MTPLPAEKVTELYFHDARSRLLDVAAVFDRLERGGEDMAHSADPRILKLREAVKILLSESGNRAERIQNVFSLEYDPNWPRPEPRSV